MAFVDVRKAFDIVWRDALLHKLWLRGVRGRAWRVCASLLRSTRSSVRVHGTTLAQWSDSSGFRQGAILSPIEFLVFVDDLAAEIYAAFPGVALGPEQFAPRVQMLLYADDIAILAENVQDLHNTLRILDAWAARWGLSFGVGTDKTAVMSFFGGPSEGASPFVHAGQQLNYVAEYKYLGVTFDLRLAFATHMARLLESGWRKFFSTCSWARREHLHLDPAPHQILLYLATSVGGPGPP